jgi:uncharacterized protein DUF5753
VLRTRVGSVETMREQLHRLRVLMSLQRISLGIIPSMGERAIWTSAGFWIFDGTTVRVEVPSAELTITQRGEVVVYEKRFAWLQRSAVYGQAARALIARALRNLESTGHGDEPFRAADGTQSIDKGL